MVLGAGAASLPGDGLPVAEGGVDATAEPPAPEDVSAAPVVLAGAGVGTSVVATPVPESCDGATLAETVAGCSVDSGVAGTGGIDAPGTGS